MTDYRKKRASLTLGVIVRQRPGVTRWVPFDWSVRAVLLNPPKADWMPLRRDGEVVDYHAGAFLLELHAADAEAYVHELNGQTPSVYVICRQSEISDRVPFQIHLLTVSPYEAQDYADNGDDLVEKVPMPEILRDWVSDFVAAHHKPVEFVKRKRSDFRADLSGEGTADPRVLQPGDVYHTPGSHRQEVSG